MVENGKDKLEWYRKVDEGKVNTWYFLREAAKKEFFS